MATTNPLTLLIIPIPMVKNCYHKNQQQLDKLFKSFTVTEPRTKIHGETEKTKMEQEKEQLVNWDDVMKESGNDFLNFEDLRERKTLVMTGIHVIKVVKKKYQSEEEAEMDELRAEVLAVGEDKTVKKIWTNSRRFMQGLGVFLKPLGTAEDINKLVISISVKKLGKDQGTNYDFEDFQIIEALVED